MYVWIFIYNIYIHMYILDSSMHVSTTVCMYVCMHVCIYIYAMGPMGQNYVPQQLDSEC